MKLFFVYVIAILLTLTGCNGSEVYQGKWKATDAEGKHYEIEFSPQTFTIKDQQGQEKQYDYSQNSIVIENSVRTYGIKLTDGRALNVFFPLAGNTEKGMITLQNNLPMYTISRSDYVQYQDFYKLMD